MPDALEGRCACGAVRYRLNAAPMFVHCCHCLDCQRLTGGAFAINILIETGQVEVLEGSTDEVPVPADSGRPQLVHRCGDCQTALWSHYGSRTPIAFVRAGTLDDPSAVAPDVHIFTRSKLPWVGLPDRTPAFDVYYDSSSLWPADSLERRRAALG